LTSSPTTVRPWHIDNVGAEEEGEEEKTIQAPETKGCLSRLFFGSRRKKNDKR